MKKRYSEEQIIGFLQVSDSGISGCSKPTMLAAEISADAPIK